MDNKLSELSKPVGHFIEWQDAETGEKEWCECSEQNGNPLYSQEYVSALTQRIAELESANKSQDDHINQQQDRIDSLEKTNAGLGRRLGDTEKRLATPVRLPALLHPESDAVNGMIFANGRNEAIAECSVAIRQAGFLSEASPMTAEGDE